jgi:hypothetical protein
MECLLVDDLLTTERNLLWKMATKVLEELKGRCDGGETL